MTAGKKRRGMLASVPETPRRLEGGGEETICCAHTRNGQRIIKGGRQEPGNAGKKGNVERPGQHFFPGGVPMPEEISDYRVTSEPKKKRKKKRP